MATLVGMALIAATVVVVLVRPWQDVARIGLGHRADRPSYEIDARIDPRTGNVRGELTVRVPADVGGDKLRFRVVPNAEGYDADFRLGRVTVGGEKTRPRLDKALLVVARGSSGGTTVTMSFRYQVMEGETSPLASLGLLPSDRPMVAGLLARYDTGISLGHWYPFLIADGAAATPELAEVGDVGSAPAADVRASIIVPKGFQVISGGETKDRTAEGNSVVVDERASGIRELSLVVSDRLERTTREEGGVEVNVWAPRDASTHATEVAAMTARGLGVFEENLGGYPWPSLDVVQAPMPPGVGGMEWQGMFWVGSEIFRGTMPGVPEQFAEVLGENAGLEDVREFTVVHELAHQWWQGMVGVDQATHEVVDEPLAQYTTCLYFAKVRPTDWKTVCDRNVSMNYRYMRTMGEDDAAADRPTSAFGSDKQYAGVVYGKAPNFYRALEKEVDRLAVVAGLHRLVQERSGELATPDDVVTALQREVPTEKRAEVRALWRHWMAEQHGDTDVGTKLLP